MITRPIAGKHAIVAIYVLCFGLGTLSHGRDFLLNGLRPYAAAPLPFEAFWSSLIFIDIVVIGFLCSRNMRFGVVLALAIMLADVAINTYATMMLGIDILVGPLVLQSVFLGFMVGTIGFVLKR